GAAGAGASPLGTDDGKVAGTDGSDEGGGVAGSDGSIEDVVLRCIRSGRAPGAGAHDGCYARPTNRDPCVSGTSRNGGERSVRTGDAGTRPPPADEVGRHGQPRSQDPEAEPGAEDDQHQVARERTEAEREDTEEVDHEGRD